MSTAIIENTDSIKCTLKFTMSLNDWKQIRKTLRTNSAYIEVQVIEDINDLVDQLEKTIYVNRNIVEDE